MKTIEIVLENPRGKRYTHKLIVGDYLVGKYTADKIISLKKVV